MIAERPLRIVAIETSSRQGSVALLEAQGDPSIRWFERGLVHGRKIVCHLRDLLSSHGLGPQDITLVAVSVGPGSYTGVRIGVITAKTLGFSLEIPVVPVPSLRVLAENAWSGSAVAAPVLDARRGQVYGGLFFRENPGTGVEEFVGPPEEFAARLPRDASVFGDGVCAYPEAFKAFPRGDTRWETPDARVVARLGRIRAGDGLGVRGQAIHALSPRYLRPSEAEIRLREGRIPGSDLTRDPSLKGPP